MNSMKQFTPFISPKTFLQEAGVAADMVVADLGCGSGFFSFAAAELVGDRGEVYAVDIRADILGHIESQKNVFGKRNVLTIQADLASPGSTGILDDSVDFVLLAKILHDVEDMTPVFNEAHRILKEGGKAVVLEWLAEKTFPGLNSDQLVSFDEMKELVKSHNFVIEDEIATDDFHYAFIMKEPKLEF